MGGVAPQIVHTLEEGTSTALKQGVENWFTTSGKAFLKDLGPAGEFLSGHLQHYEAYKAGAASRAQAAVEQIHTDPAKLTGFKNSVVRKLQQSGTPIDASKVTEPFVYHPDLQNPNSTLRKQAITEIRTKTGFTQAQAIDTVNKIITDQNTRNATTNMLDPIFPLQTGLLPVKERYQKWGRAAAEKVAQNVYFGPQDRNLAAVVHTIKTSKGLVSASNAADFLDVFLHNTMTGAYRIEGLKHQSAYQAPKEWEKVVRQVGSYTFVSRIAIPHSTQWVNTVFNSGVQAVFEGITELIKDPLQAAEFVKSSGALDEELRRELEVSIRGGQSWYDKFLRHPGFSWVREQGLKFSAVIGKHEARDAAEQLLKNSNSKDAAVTLGKLGINPNDVLHLKGLSPEMERSAAYYAANRDMFLNTPLNTPFRWSATPAARIRTMYKPFSFNMSRMIKENLQNEWNKGETKADKVFNVSKSLAVLATIFPVAGELVSLAENLALGNKLNDTDTPFSPAWKEDHQLLDHYLNAMSHVSAFGIAYSMFRSAKRRMLSNFFLGPAESSFLDILGDTAKGITSGDFKPLGRDVIRKIPLVGPAASKQFIPPTDKTSYKPQKRKRSL